MQSKPYKNRRLKCQPGHKQCGGVCINKEENCHKGKAAIVKQNVKNEIKRLEEGKEPGAVTNKAMAKLLLEKPDIGQELPKALSPYIASSDKIDDRVKKSYFDSATRKSWNIDDSHGSRPSIKLKQQDEKFARMLNNRAMEHNKTHVEPNHDAFKKKAKNFFKSKDGKKVLKLIAATAVVGAVAAYGIYSAKQTKDSKLGSDKDPMSPKNIANESYKKPEEKVAASEAMKTAKAKAGTDVSGYKIEEDNPNTVSTAAEVYANTYKRAQQLHKKIPDGLSEREAKDYKDYWGYDAGTRMEGMAPKEGSRLYDAEKELESYAKKKNPKITKEEIDGIKATAQMSSIDQRIKDRRQQQYNPETKEWENRKYYNYDKEGNVPEGYNTGVSRGHGSESLYEDYKNNAEKRLKEKLAQQRLEQQNLNPFGNEIEQDAFQQVYGTQMIDGQKVVMANRREKITDDNKELDWVLPLVQGGINKQKENPLGLEDATIPLTVSEANTQRAEWGQLDKQRKNMFVNAAIINDGTQKVDPDVFSVITDGLKYGDKTDEKVLDDITSRLYYGAKEIHGDNLEQVQLSKWDEIKRRMEKGEAVLPKYRFGAGGGEIGVGGSQDKDYRRKGQTDEMGIENVAVTEREPASASEKTAQEARGGIMKTPKQKFTIDDYKKNIGKKYRQTQSDGTVLLTDRKNRKFRINPDGTIVRILKNGATMKMKFKDFDKLFEFNELTIYEVLDIGDNNFVVDTIEGPCALLFSEDYYQMILL